MTTTSMLGVVMVLAANFAVSSALLGGGAARSRAVAEQDKDMRVARSVLDGLGAVRRDGEGRLTIGGTVLGGTTPSWTASTT